MAKEKPQTIVYNYGTFNDIHDNPYSTIYTTAPTDKLKKEQAIQEETSKKEQAYTPTTPKEGDYNEVREYIVLRKKYDEDFRVFWDGVRIAGRLACSFFEQHIISDTINATLLDGIFHIWANRYQACSFFARF